MAKMGSYDLYTEGTSAEQQAKFKETAKILATGKTDDEGESTNLNIPLSDISGDKLPTGGNAGQVLKKTAKGTEWGNEKTELPTGGNAGQVLKKTANGSEWGNEKTELPSGGNAGQVLKKTANGSEWANEKTELPTGGSAGDVLKKTANGTEWGSAGGGTDLPPLPQDAATKNYVLGIKDGVLAWTELTADATVSSGYVSKINAIEYK